MNLRDCLDQAVAQGALNSRQADELESYFTERFGRNRRAGMSDAEAARSAKAAVSEQLRAEAKENQRRLLLTEAKRKELTDHLDNFRDIKGRVNMVDAVLSLMIHTGYKGGSSMKGLESAIYALHVNAPLAEVMHHFRRTGPLGVRENKIDLADLARELNGEATGRPEVRAMADALANVYETLRQRFNAAGGNIPKREGFDLTHSHDAQALLKLDKDPLVARDKWKAFIRPLLDPSQMTDPRTGEVIGEAGIDDSLNYVWESITSDGWAHRKPEARKFGQGALHSRYQDTRFLEFRDAQSWLAYNDRFGKADMISSLFNDFKSMTADIAALETFGPNPDAMIEWLKQVVNTDYGKMRAGGDRTTRALMKAKGLSMPEAVNERVDSLWKALRGRETVWTAPAQISSDIRNVATAAMLGSTSILAAVTDPFVAAASRALAGMPIWQGFGRLTRDMAREAVGRKASLQAARRGIIWDDFLHSLNQEARYADQVFGHDWSKYMVDRALTWNGLIPITRARKRIEATAWHDTLGGFAEQNMDWVDLPALMRKTMEGFGFVADDWHKMRAGVDAMGFLDPVSVMQKTGDQRLAERYAEMINQWSERSVPSGDVRIKSVVQGKSGRGTVTGEIADFATQFLSFGMSFTARQLEAMHIMAMQGNSPLTRLGRGAAYSGSLALTLTLGAAMYQQILTALDGKEPIDMNPLENPGFWVKSFVKGGGGGLFADFLQNAESRFGSSFQETIPGPGVAFISDTLDLTLGSVMRLLQGDDAQFGRKLTNYVGRYTPVVSSHPATRLLYRRGMVDQLQWMADPEAERSFRAKRSRHDHWWQPGESRPDRLPLGLSN